MKSISHSPSEKATLIYSFEEGIERSEDTLPLVLSTIWVPRIDTESPVLAVMMMSHLVPSHSLLRYKYVLSVVYYCLLSLSISLEQEKVQQCLLREYVCVCVCFSFLLVFPILDSTVIILWLNSMLVCWLFQSEPNLTPQIKNRSLSWILEISEPSSSG